MAAASATGSNATQGRKYVRTGERFLAQVYSVRDPLLTEIATVEDQSSGGVRLATEESWELGSHVEVKSVAGDLSARARVVYCKALGPKKLVIGLNILSRDGDQGPKPKNINRSYVAALPSRAIATPNFSSHFNRPVICMTTNSVRIAPIVTANPVKPSKKNAYENSTR